MQHSFSRMNQYSYGSPLRKNSSVKPSKVISFHSTAQWKAHFEASKGTTKLMVIEFTASWCGPCRVMEPFIEDLAAKHANVEFIKIDVDELMGVANEFKVQIMPTVVLMKNGVMVDKVTGVKKEELQRKIENHNCAYRYNYHY